MSMADSLDSTGTDKDRFYYQYVDRVFQDSVDAKVSNTKPDHIDYLLQVLLTNAQHQVRLFAGDWGVLERKAVFESAEFAEAAKHFLSQRGNKLVIVVGDKDEAGSKEEPLVKSIMQLAVQGQIDGVMEIRRAPQKAVNFLRKHDLHHPLAVMDKSAYRIETGNSVLPAYANFGDQKMARSYADLFDDVLYQDSEEIVAVPNGNSASV